MNAAQIHLALNHAPLFFSIVGGLILLYGFIRKNDSIKILSLYFMIAAALLTIPVYLTGEGTEEMIENLPGVSENMIHEHEEMAEIGLFVMIATGVVALAALVVRQKAKLLKTGLILCVVLSFASFAVMAQTAHLGGQIRHSEITNGGNSAAENGDKKNDDD
ncbi:MAG: hypothetical protein HZB42_06020 [Sphingobacteriales bacterium]|nr:hypothetical protein [Sphingobacteriales bacterium]